MENLNFIPILVAALIPTVVGFLYYNPKTVGGAWMKALGKTEDELMEGFNMAVVMIVSLILSFILAFGINTIIELIHKDVDETGKLVMGSFHTFKHGAFHGAMLAIFVLLPPFITNGLYERKSWNLMGINMLYWVITFALIGGLTDAWN